MLFAEFSIVMTVESCAGQAMTPAGNGDALGRGELIQYYWCKIIIVMLK